MKKIITILVLLVSFFGFSQKVKFKKEKVIIDDVEVFAYEKEGFMYTFSTLSSVEFISVLSTIYQERNPAHYNQNNPQAYRFPALLNKEVNTVKFLKSGRELFTDLSDKEIIKAVFKAKLVNENGEIDEEKLDVFITKYNNENLKLKIN
jgi:CRISPR/Cas system endoribonuclease Cas6 (RAMP superfamily)